ncbi:MAG TPA: DUF3501 family protein [Stellaceae bacterium]|nr:DUF3501 family protein [Stellaceae bacterium]
MSAPRRTIEPADILPRARYAPVRAALRREIAAHKRNRRVDVGPFAAFCFEDWATVRHQIQEMLYIENGGEAQLEEEIAAYAPLVPRGNELVATAMFEIDDAARRKLQLLRIGGIEHHALLRIGAEEIRGIPDPDRENTAADGKASAVQFFHFPLTEAQAADFRDATTAVQLGFDHPNYGHIALMPKPVQAALAEDL